MREALGWAQRAAELGEVPVGAVVVYQGRVIAHGYNERELTQDFAAHAEFLAMQRAAKVLGTWRLEECTVYVTLEPCPMCAGAMVNARVPRVVYGASDPKGGFCGTLFDMSNVQGLNHAFQVDSGIEAEACGAILRDFFRQLRRS